MGRKILAITDMDSVGSGYKHICIPLLTGLAKLGYEIKVSGLGYRMEEHNHPFSILPAQTLEESIGIANNLIQLWMPDIVLVALDLPLQARAFAELSRLLPRFPHEPMTTPRKYIAITPLENGPLTMSWAAPLFNMDAIFFISELGKQEAIKSGVRKAEHLVIGEDTVAWHPATPEEKKRLREGLGISQDAFVILTVADNQERKNLWAGMKAVSLLKKEIERPIRYLMVTRIENPYGWRLRDLAITMDINQEFVPFERGMSQKDLWGLYAVADVYLQPSKAEGLGLPVMDAMACGIPVVATDTGAMHELLENGRGMLAPSEYEFVDVWGNSRRSMINVNEVAKALKDLSETEISISTKFVYDAYEYIKGRTWDVPVQQINNRIEELLK